MRAGLRNALVLSLLIAAAGLTWYWSRPAPERVRPGDRAAALGYYMLDGVLAFTNAEGSTDFQIRFARLTELPDQDRVALADLEIAQALNDSAWRISADAAAGPADGSVFVLEGNVILYLERPGGEPYVVRMPLVEFDRARQAASASGPIELFVGGRRITADELEVDLNDRRLRLKSVQGMKTSPLTNAVAMAAFGAAAAAQDDNAERAENPEEVAVDFSSVSVDCAEECVFQGFEFTGENWRIEAGEARAREIDAVGDGEVRLRDVRFEFEDMLLNVPSAVFQFANDAIVRAELTGDEVQLETDGARFTAQSIVFTFVDEEPATVELSGEPALFEDLSAERPRRRTASAGTMFYDYRERELRALGETTYRQEGRLELRCIEGLSYDLDTGGFRSGECEGAGVLGGRDAPAPAQAGDPPPESAP